MAAASPVMAHGRFNTQSVILGWDGNASIRGEDMRNAVRRKQDIWFVQRTRDDSHMDPVYVYSKPEKHRFSVSSTAGSPLEINAGILPNYSRYIISYDRKYKPVEGTYLYVDKVPQLDKDGGLVLDESGRPVTRPDYILDSVADTQKGILARYGIRKVSDSDVN